MNKEQIREKIKDLASGIKDFEGNPLGQEITYFQQGENLIIPETTDSDIFSESGPGKTRGRGKDEGKTYGPGEEPGGKPGDDIPEQPTDDPDGPQGEDEPKDEEPKDGEPGDEGDGKGGDDTKIKVGTKVKIKGTNQQGVVTAVNDDGTYRVEPEFADGGEIEPVVSGDYEEEQLEVISESEGGDGEGEDGEGGEREGEEKEGEEGEGEEKEGEEKEDEEKEGKGEGKSGGKSGTPPPVRPPDPSEGPEGEPGPPQPPPPPGPQGPPPQLPTLNVYDLKERLRRVKNADFKFPNFAKSFYNADLSAITSPYITENMEMDFTYFDKAKMALYHIYAKNIYDRKFKEKDAQNFLWLISKYDSHLRFLFYSVDRSTFKIAENQFFKIDLTKKVMSNAMFQILILPDIIGGGMGELSEENELVNNTIGSFLIGTRFSINLEEMTISASLQFMENLLNDCPDTIDENNPNYKDVFLTLITLDALDNIIVRDDGYYKFLSLMAFVNQDLFGEYWLETNMEFMCKFFNTNKLVFTNLKPYNQFFLVDEIIERLTVAMETENKNLDTWNIIKVEKRGARDEFRVYKGRNLRLRSDADITDEASIEKNSLLFADKLLISQDIQSFYIAINNILSTDSRKQCYKNLQNIFNLQLNSYMDFLNELESQTYLTYQI